MLLVGLWLPSPSPQLHPHMLEYTAASWKGQCQFILPFVPLLGSGSLHVSHALMGVVIYPHGSAVGAREELSQLHYGPSALKIAFICLLTLSLWFLKLLQLLRSPKDADEREMVILHTGMLSRSCF